MDALPTDPTRRAWLGLAVLALPCVVYAVDLTALNLALPAISRDLRPSAAQQLWIVDLYGFLVAGSLITMGALGDRLGARRVLFAGAVFFAVASVLASLAPSAGTLIAARGLLGVAGATIAPSTLSLIRTLFPDDRRRTLAIGVWITSYSAGSAVGPLAGGAVLELTSWRVIQLLGVPVMALLLVVGPRVLPPDRERVAARLDLRSAALSLGAVLGVVYGVKQLATGGATAPAVVVMAIGFALAVAFVERQRRLDDPLIDLALFRVPVFSVALATNLVAFMVVFGLALFFTQVLQSVLGLSPLTAGLWTAPEALGFVAGSMLAPRVVGRWPAGPAIAVGTAVGGLGYLVIALGGPTVASIVVGSTVASLGLGVVVTLVTDLAVGAAPPERAGAAAATSETSSELGGALGIALLGSLGAAVYRAGLPADAPGTARATLGGALTTGGANLHAAARDAFGHALVVASGVGAALLLMAAAVAFAVLRRAGPAEAESSAEAVLATV